MFESNQKRASPLHYMDVVLRRDKEKKVQHLANPNA